MMPNKTIYVADADMPLYERAQALEGGNLSAAIAAALRRYVGEREPGTDEVVITINEDGITTKKRFRGTLLAEQKVAAQPGDRATTYRIYQTAKGHFALWSRQRIDYHQTDWWQHLAPEDWQTDWWRSESHLTVFESLEDLRDVIPERLLERVTRIVTTGSEIEDLDI